MPNEPPCGILRGLRISLDLPNFEMQDALVVLGAHRTEFFSRFELVAFADGCGFEVAVDGSKRAVREDDGLAGAGDAEHAGYGASENGEGGASGFGGDVDAVVVNGDAGK